MRKVFRASVLLLALSCPMYAGEIGYGSPAPPPPNGEIQNGAQVALSLLQSLLALF